MNSYERKLIQIKRDPKIQRLHKYQQHTVSNTYDHVFHVARMSHTISKNLHLKVSEDEMLRGAILHDYYLYDFREKPMGAYAHGTSHAAVALKNAEKDYHLTDREKNIIYSHMWPLNLTHFPKCKEAWVVTAADKICAFQEMVLHKHHKEDIRD